MNSWDQFPMDAESWRLLAMTHRYYAREEKKCRNGQPHDRNACNHCADSGAYRDLSQVVQAPIMVAKVRP